MKRLYVSYSYENSNFYYLLKSQVQEIGLEIVCADIEPVNSTNEKIIKKMLIKEINKASMVLTFIPSYSNWVEWELRTARELGIPILGVSVGGNEKKAPKIISDLEITIIDWTFDSLVSALKSEGNCLY